MRTRPFGRHVTWILATTMLLGVPACGGGGTTPGGDDDGGGPAGVTNLTYAATVLNVETDTAIVPNQPTYDGDPATSWMVAPPLPPGLVMNPDNGVIAGVPTAASPSAAYTVTAFNDAGGDTVDVTITVNWTEDKSLAPKTNLTEDDLRHFMHRTHWGFSQPHWDFLQQQINDPAIGNGDAAAGLAAYVDLMTNLQKQQQLEDDASLYLKDTNDPDGLRPSQNEVAEYWLYMMLANINPFQEVLAMHWHDHFATSTDVLSSNNMYYFIPAPHPNPPGPAVQMEGHLNLLRNHASGAGNLRDLLLGLTKDQAMLEWLDGVRNNAGPKGGGRYREPNENFGREWLELFCLGVDVLYDQTDIVEASRAFSGYQSFFANGRSYTAPNNNRHDDREKTLLGVTIPAGQTIEQDYESVVDITLNAVDPDHGRSACGRWIVRQLLRRFVYENPPENVINELTEILETNNWDIKPMLTTLFVSEAFFSARAKGEQFVTTPTEAGILFMRQSTIVTAPEFLRFFLFLMGNLPSRPSVVDGWPEGVAWYSGQGMIDRANLYEFVLRGGTVDNLRAIVPAAPADAGEVVDALTERMRIDLSPQERTYIEEYLNTDESNPSVPDPFDINDDAVVNTRIRGALYILAQHPSATTR